MRAKLIYVENGKITFTKKELEDLLKDTYDEGYRDGSYYNNSITSTNRSITINDGNGSAKRTENPNPWASPFIYAGDTITCTNTISNASGTAGTVSIDLESILKDNGVDINSATPVAKLKND